MTLNNDMVEKNLAFKSSVKGKKYAKKLSHLVWLVTTCAFG